ncbi:hypothetical protein PBY51_012257 [Eleginops maclovinus]|uniref:Heat shock factor-binding protein 1 n=1 Tax=Eleginops maclovinus TaxID=56733 RepID=A0AAN7XPV8_ELEMC|nr:hypothetical protein PBY51_012257 [Eleginops maclovinus]
MAETDPKSVQDLTNVVQTLLQQMQDKFQTMSDQIIGRIDEMSTRIDDLEKNIADLMTQAGAPNEGSYVTRSEVYRRLFSILKND